ncbi:MAG: dethiobiotin synthase [Bacillota bacterium]
MTDYQAADRAAKPDLPSLFVTGTDTGVGKTVVSALIGLIYQAAGLTVGYLKPVETGAAKVGDELVPADAKFVAAVLGLEDEPIEMLCPYRYEQPVSPHLAALLSKRPVKSLNIRECFNYLDRRYDAVIVEGAGGLLVPVSPNYMIADMARDLELPLLITARPGLGTINHTLLTVAAALQADLHVAGVVINRYPENPGLVERNNPKAVADYSGVPVLALVPEIAGLNPENPETALLKEAARRLNETYRLDRALAALASKE